MEVYLEEARLPLVSPQKVSRKFLTEKNLSRELRTCIGGRIEEDMKLFHWFRRLKETPLRVACSDQSAPLAGEGVFGGVFSTE
jgi:hypothetical protein